MNPAGKWIETGHGTLFQNNQIMAIYGFVQYKVKSDFPWKWQANVILDAQESVTAPPITGYAPTKDMAKEIVECILRNTHTCEFGTNPDV